MPLSCMCTGEIAALCPGRESTVLRFIQVRSKPKGREQRAAPARSSGAGATVHHRGTRPARSFSEQLAGWARASLDVKTVDSLLLTFVPSVVTQAMVRAIRWVQSVGYWKVHMRVHSHTGTWDTRTRQQNVIEGSWDGT